MDKLLTIIFFIILIVLFPLGELARIDLQNNIAVIGVDVGVLLIAALGVVTLIVKRKKISAKLQKTIGIFLLICFCSLVVNIPRLSIFEFFVSILYLVRFACYVGVYFIIIELTPFIRKKIIDYLTISGFFILLIGYIQFFFYPSLRNLYYLGWDEHLYRMFGSFLDPNFLGAFLVLYFLFVLALLFKQYEKKRIFFATLLGFIGILTIIGITLTYSRSAYLMLTASLITFFAVKKMRGRVLITIGGAIIIGLVSFFSLTKHSEGTNLFRTSSTKAHIFSLQNAYTIFQKNPILGVGFNSYRYAQQRYGFIKENNPIENHAGAGVDNSFLFVLATTGIVGLASYLYLWISVLKLAFSQRKENVVAVSVFSSIIGLFVNSLFINSLFYPFILVWMWIMIGITENK